MSSHLQPQAGHTAVIRVRLFPRRLRPRRLHPDQLREAVDPLTDVSDGLGGILVGLGVWLAVLVAAPLLVVLLAVLLLPVELTVLLIVAVLLLTIRLSGITRWTVIVTEPDGQVSIERYRNLVRAYRRVGEVNGTGRARVRFSWT